MARYIGQRPAYLTGMLETVAAGTDLQKRRPTGSEKLPPDCAHQRHQQDILDDSRPPHSPLASTQLETALRTIRLSSWVLDGGRVSGAVHADGEKHRPETLRRFRRLQLGVRHNQPEPIDYQIEEAWPVSGPSSHHQELVRRQRHHHATTTRQPGTTASHRRSGSDKATRSRAYSRS